VSKHWPRATAAACRLRPDRLVQAWQFLVQFAGEALSDRAPCVVHEFPNALLVLAPAGLLEAPHTHPAAEGALPVVDKVGGSVALNGKGAAKPGRQPVTVGRWLTQFGQEVGGRIGGQVLEQSGLALLEDLGRGLALGHF
jgi:hypothetical protein